MTPREAGIQAFYADESTSNTLQGLNAAFDAYEAAAKPAHDDLLAACKAALATHGCEKSEPGLPTLREVEDMLRAAVAKAEA